VRRKTRTVGKAPVVLYEKARTCDLVSKYLRSDVFIDALAL